MICFETLLKKQNQQRLIQAGVAFLGRHHMCIATLHCVLEEFGRTMTQYEISQGTASLIIQLYSSPLLT